MKLFQKTRSLYAVCDGECRELSTIPDEALGGGMLGQGVAIEPREGSFFSPADGVVVSVATTGHAYTLQTDDGVDVLIHVGVDTVTLGGKGFTPLVREGQRVEAGTPIARVELSEIREKGLPTVTAVLVTEPERLETIEYRYGSVSGGKDAVMRFRVGRKG